MYSIVDVETTGGTPESSRITEIAIFRLENGSVVDKFVTLINPERYIPDYITRLTGITNEMVEDAPKFYQIAKRIVEITKDTTFVAHNVAFDFNIIKSEFNSLGYRFDLPQLCTVKLSRSIFPGHKSYSLGNLCDDLNIVLDDRHRAGGDASATVELFKRILDANGGIILENDPYKKVEFDKFPNHIDKEFIKSIPNTSGVYYFKNVAEDFIYIGKSKNLRNRIIEHLNGNRTKKSQELRNEIFDINFEETGNELVALLKESSEVKIYQPKYNVALKKKKTSFGIVNYIDRKGYVRLLIRLNDGVTPPIMTFETIDEARKNLYRWVDEFNLCQKLCGLYEGNHGCFQYQIKQCNGACVGEETCDAYNARVQTLIDKIEFGYKNLVIIDKGRNQDEVSVVYVEDGKYVGYGYVGMDDVIRSPQEFREHVYDQGDDRDSKQLIKNYLRHNRPIKLIEF